MKYASALTSLGWHQSSSDEYILHILQSVPTYLTYEIVVSPD